MLLLQGPPIRSLVVEPRSHRPCSMAKKKKKKTPKTSTKNLKCLYSLPARIAIAVYGQPRCVSDWGSGLRSQPRDGIHESSIGMSLLWMHLGLFGNRPPLTGALTQQHLVWLLFSASRQCRGVCHTESHTTVSKLGINHKTLSTGVMNVFTWLSSSIYAT